MGSLRVGSKQLIVIGDRVLVRPDNPDERTKVGLYLPQTVLEKEPIQAGRVVATGPGIAIPNLTAESGEPWQERREPQARYIPPQAELGDYALFLRKDAVEITYRDEKYLVVPQAAILLLIRDEDDLYPGMG